MRASPPPSLSPPPSGSPPSPLSSLPSGVALLILAAGRSRRLGGDTPKAFRRLEGRPVLSHSLWTALGLPWVTQILLVVPPERLAGMQEILSDAVAPPGRETSLVVLAGGEERPDSVRAALGLLEPSVGWIVVHDAARPFASPALFDAVLAAARLEGAATAFLAPTDALRWREAPPAGPLYLPRDALALVQTPQAFRRELLEEAHRAPGAALAPDDASLVSRAGHAVALVPGEPDNFKITGPKDWERAASLARGRAAPSPAPASAPFPRVGQGYDVHRLTRGRPLWLAGVQLASARGLLGHSDADVACHALGDALLGAAGLGDLGEHFPPGAPEWKDASGARLLGEVAARVRRAGFEIGNLDVTILAERPAVAPHRQRMREALAAALGVRVDQVSVKATTNEGLGPVGQGVCIAAHAVALCLPAGS